MKLLLLGPPASGKGTVGGLLSEKIKLPITSVGALFRALPESNPYYELIHDQMDKGELVPNQVAAGVLQSELKEAKYANGFILDGWMRDLEQKEHFEPDVDWAIFIKVSEDTVIKRISGRRFCPRDRFMCNVFTLPPKNPNHCDKCSGELEQRDDDNEEVVKTRLDLYHNDTVPVIEYYRGRRKLLEVDGEGTPEEVLELILSALPKNDTN